MNVFISLLETWFLIMISGNKTNVLYCFITLNIKMLSNCYFNEIVKFHSDIQRYHLFFHLIRLPDSLQKAC